MMNIKDFHISSKMENVRLDLAIFEESNTYTVLKFQMKAEEKIVPSEVKIEWAVPVN